MTKENVSLDKKIKWIKKFSFSKNKTGFMSEKPKQMCRVLNYFEHFVVLHFCSQWMCFNFCICFISWCSCRCCEFCSRIKNECNQLKNISQLLKKKRKKCNKIVLLAKVKLNTMEVLISKTLINSYISHGKLVSVKIVLREYNDKKWKILKMHWKWKCIVSVVKKNTANRKCSIRKSG